MQASLSAEEGGIRDLGLERAAAREADGSNSRYEEPDAVGINPVFKTVFNVSTVHEKLASDSLQIFRSSAGWRWRWARSAAPVVDCCRDSKTGGLVPPGGPLTRLLSAISKEIWWCSSCREIAMIEVPEMEILVFALFVNPTA